MKCPQCQEEAIQNTANHKVFFYCRTCKSEVDEYFLNEDPTEFNLTDEEWDEIEKALGPDYLQLNDLDDSIGDDFQ